MSDNTPTDLIASTLIRHAERRPCTNRQYFSVSTSETGNSSIAFNAGSVGPTRSISDDSSFNNSVVNSEYLTCSPLIDIYRYTDGSLPHEHPLVAMIRWQHQRRRKQKKRTLSSSLGQSFRPLKSQRQSISKNLNHQLTDDWST